MRGGGEVGRYGRSHRLRHLSVTVGRASVPMSELFTVIAVLVIARWYFRSPLCESMAEGLRRWSRSHGPQDEALAQSVHGLSEQVAALREEVLELGERVDFAERALTAVRQGGVHSLPGRE